MQGRIVFMGLLSLSCISVVLAQENFFTLLEKGNAYYEKFENRRAAELYQRAYTLRPNDFKVLERLVRAYHDYGLDLVAKNEKKAATVSLAKAVAYAEELEIKYPNRAETYFYLAATNGSLARLTWGKTKVRMGKAVEQHCRRAIDLDSSFALAHAVLGVFYREVASLNPFERAFAKLFFGGVPKGSKEEAIRSLTRAVELDPELNMAHYELAVTYDQVGQQEKAIEHMQIVVNLAPQTSQDRRNQLLAEQHLERHRR